MPLFQHNPHPMTDAEIEKTVAPIALFPDPLLALMLPAATYQKQVHAAAKYLRGRTLTDKVYYNLDRHHYDLSVESLARYPLVLGLMDENPSWTAALGYAYGHYPEQTLSAIQRLRQHAYHLGTLYNNKYNHVNVAGDTIEVVPESPEQIYVPQYDPHAAFYTLPPRVPAVHVVNYSAPFAISAWLNRGINWTHRQIFYHGWQANNGGWVAASSRYIGDPGWFGAPILGRPVALGTTMYATPIVGGTMITSSQPVYIVHYPQTYLYGYPGRNLMAAPHGGLGRPGAIPMNPRPGAIPMPRPR